MQTVRSFVGMDVHKETISISVAEDGRNGPVKKGTQLFIEGKIQTRSWDDKQSGEKKYKTEILVLEMSLLGGGQDSERAARDQGSSSRSSSSKTSGSKLAKEDYGASGSQTMTFRSETTTSGLGPLRRASSLLFG